jgi:hypothetical protein
MLNFLSSGLRRVMTESFTTAAGEFDPARVIGYGFVGLSGFVFLFLTMWVTMKSGVFDTDKFAMGVGAVSAAILAAAGGVQMKNGTEKPLDTTRASVSDTPNGTTATLVSTTTSASATAPDPAK